MSQQSFRALGVSAEVEHVLAARNITSPFRIQSLVLADALAGSDVLAKAPTGSGKTLAFALPIVERTKYGIKTISLSPNWLWLPTSRNLPSAGKFSNPST